MPYLVFVFAFFFASNVWLTGISLIVNEAVQISTFFCELIFLWPMLSLEFSVFCSTNCYILQILVFVVRTANFFSVGHLFFEVFMVVYNVPKYCLIKPKNFSFFNFCVLFLSLKTFSLYFSWAVVYCIDDFIHEILLFNIVE
jgi:hypothetical protein